MCDCAGVGVYPFHRILLDPLAAQRKRGRVVVSRPVRVRPKRNFQNEEIARAWDDKLTLRQVLGVDLGAQVCTCSRVAALGWC